MDSGRDDDVFDCSTLVIFRIVRNEHEEIHEEIGGFSGRNRHQSGTAGEAWKEVYEGVFSKHGWAAMRTLDGTRSPYDDDGCLRWGVM